jgi:glucose/arabinose dehydrogenase|tara:strand:+ start:30500 stop:31675 length:1176 start_codon:yes stop_codon:yes gene_type:complete
MIPLGKFKQFKIMRLAIVLSCLVLFTSCTSEKPKGDKSGTAISLGYLEAPAGFSVEVYAENVPNARQMAMGKDGILYVGTRRDGRVHAVVDRDNDFKADTIFTIASDLRLPNGVAYKDGSLYVAEVSKIWRFDNIDENLQSPPEPVLVTDDYPTEGHHGWKYIAFGPDDKLYVPVGAPCNVCNREDENPIFASLTRINADGSNREIIAHGIRNTVGFTWHPETGNVWFTDNNRDWMGDDLPPGELNELTEEGQHFGFPFLHANDVWDPEFGEAGKAMDKEFKTPVRELGPHVAGLGVMFYTGKMFPESYKNQALIAEHGSWNRSEKIGYRITMVKFDDNGNPISYEPFVTGWLQGEEDVRGRPVALLQLKDGSVLISDDHGNKIYRLTYEG